VPVRWRVKISQPGKFSVRAPMACPDGTRLVIEAAGQSLSVAVPTTGAWDTFQVVDCGTLTLDKAQTYDLILKPVADGWRPINLRDVTLQPAK
jgi:hypothetical protein